LRARLSACRGVLVDSNVLLDMATNEPNWSDWSGRPLAESAEHTTLIINPIIYAEVSIGYTTIEALDDTLPTTLYQREPLPREVVSWPGSASCCTAAAEVCATRLCRISTLARTPPPDTLPCSRVMLRAIAAISDNRDPRSHETPDVMRWQGPGARAYLRPQWVTAGTSPPFRLRLGW